jgi:hypothetical protein
MCQRIWRLTRPSEGVLGLNLNTTIPVSGATRPVTQREVLVTFAYMEMVVALTDDLSADARIIGVVNKGGTLIRQGGGATDAASLRIEAGDIWN